MPQLIVLPRRRPRAARSHPSPPGSPAAPFRPSGAADPLRAAASNTPAKLAGQDVDLTAGLFDMLGGGEGMKYVLLFCGDADDAAAFAALTPDELRARYAEVGAWFTEHRAKIGGSNQLQGPETATSVRFGPDGPPVVTDGPYLEGKEAIGGYAEVDVADLDEALRMARTWLGRGTVEIRPVMTQG